MQYRRLGKTELVISRLGFGAMRLPTQDNGNLDVDESVRVIHRAFDLGVNYIDTAVMYGNYQSQSVVGKALKGWRDKVYLSTKNHYRGEDESAWRKNLEDSLERLDVDYIDVYNYHGINWAEWDRWIDGPNGILSWFQKAKDEGLIRHICTSFHDNAEALEKVANTGAFSAVTLQYNLLDQSLDPAFEACLNNDMGIIAMGPVGGGRLGGDSAQFQNLVDGAASTAEAALRFVLSNPAITACISGMGSMKMVEENCAVAGREEPLSEAERTQIGAQLEKLKGLAELYCTGCDYCMPCQSGVEIARNFTAVNTAKVYGLTDHAQALYNGMVGKASACFGCGKCEPKCPQNIPIREQLMEAVRMFDPHYGQMVLDMSPVRREDGALEVRARMHNLGNEKGAASVRFGDGMDPATADFEVEEVLKRRLETVTAPVGEGRTTLRAEVTDSVGTRTIETSFQLGECVAVDSMEDLEGRAITLDPLAIDAEDQLVVGGRDGGHVLEMKAWPGYTEEKLLIYAEIEQNGALPPAQNGPAQWYIDFVVDVRDRDDDLGPGFMPQVFLLRARLDGEGGLQAPRGGLDPAQASLAMEKQGDTTVMRLEIPWEPLCPEDMDMDDRGFEADEAFGFEMSVSGLNELNQPVYHAAWNGRSPHNNEARTGILFFAE